LPTTPWTYWKTCESTHSSLIHSIEQSSTTASQKNAQQQRQTNKHNIGAAFGAKKKKESATMDSTLTSVVRVHMKVEQLGTAITRFSAMGWCDIYKFMSQIARARARTRETQRGERESARGWWRAIRHSLLPINSHFCGETGPLGRKTSGNFLPYKEKREKEIATFLASYVTRRVMLETERHTKGPIVRWVKSSTRICLWVKSFLQGKMHISLPLKGREFFFY
jgi:hypothetical protein